MKAYIDYSYNQRDEPNITSIETDSVKTVFKNMGPFRAYLDPIMLFTGDLSIEQYTRIVRVLENKDPWG